MAVTHAFTFRAKGIPNRIITPVKVSQPTKGFTPPEKAKEMMALWDTGATGSVITPSGAKKLNLIPIGQATVMAFGGPHVTNLYLVDLHLSDKLRFQAIPTTESIKDIPDFEFIVGMDIIASGDFAISRDGGDSIVTYRYPSQGTFDFVRDLNIDVGSPSGALRNDPVKIKNPATGERIVVKRKHVKKYFNKGWTVDD